MPEPKALLRVRRIDTIGLVDKGDNPESDIVFWKREPVLPAIGTVDVEGDEDPEVVKSPPLENDPDAARAAEPGTAEEVRRMEDLEKAQSDLTAARAEADRAKAEAVAKAAEVEVAQAELAKRDEEIVTLKAARDEVIEKAERDGLAIRFAKGGDLENIGGDKRVDVLLAAKRALGELWPALETMLKAASEQIAKGGLFGEKGKGGDGEGATAWNKLEAAAKELVDKGEAKTLAQAIVAVGKRDPKLYREYKAEQKG